MCLQWLHHSRYYLLHMLLCAMNIAGVACDEMVVECIKCWCSANGVTHAKLLKKTLSGVTRCSPPPYSCTRVLTFRPLSGPGVMSAMEPSAADLHSMGMNIRQPDISSNSRRC